MGRVVAVLEEPPSIDQKQFEFGAQELLGTISYNVLMHDL